MASPQTTSETCLVSNNRKVCLWERRICNDAGVELAFVFAHLSWPIRRPSGGYMVGDPNPRGQKSRKSSAYKDVFSQDVAEVGRYPVNVGGIAQRKSEEAGVQAIAAGPPAPLASRATRIHARSTTLARRVCRPVRGQANMWSPNRSTCPPQPGDGPQHPEATGRGMRYRRRRASCMASDNSVVAASLGMAVSHAPARGPACDRSSARHRESRACVDATGGTASHAASHRRWRASGDFVPTNGTRFQAFFLQ